MKLYLRRGQAKGMLGGTSFELTARVELTPDESSLVSKYKADKEVLLEKQIAIPFMNRTVALNINIGTLTKGQSFKCKDIADVLNYEGGVREACQNFKTYLDAMKNFGGEEVIDFN